MSNLHRLGVLGGLLSLGAFSAAVAIGFGMMPLLLGVPPMAWPFTLALSLGAVGFIGIALVRLRGTLAGLTDPDTLEEPRRSDVLYGHSLVGIGATMLIIAVASTIIVASLAWTTGRLTTVSDDGRLVGDEFDAGAADVLRDLATDLPVTRLGVLFGETPAESRFVAALFVLSTFVALLGALFYFANSLWTKLTEAEREPFDRSIFWAGLWFRLGEAVIFNVVLFLMFRYWWPERYLVLPLMSLLIGMYLKAGEKLVAGSATRLFAAFAALVPTTIPAGEQLKMVELDLDGAIVDGALTESGRALVEGLGQIKGVSRVVPDLGSGIMRVEFDASTVNGSRIAHEVRLHGLAARATDDE
ncbi:MAG: hypothetical protein KDA25_09365 [Phycisphaerales bacterium]|nr:hypothetical protein [Phycisphaerales bacterium]